MFNEIVLVGRLTRDAEVGQLPNERHTPRLRFTVATDRDYEIGGETPTDFWPIEILGEYGPRLAPHLTKGRLVLISGAAHINQRHDDNGGLRVFPYVAAKTVRFLERRATSETEGTDPAE